ncbi:MAG: dienelactone hydrolase family protein [Bdellovibrionales bacterium]
MRTKIAKFKALLLAIALVGLPYSAFARDWVYESEGQKYQGYVVNKGSKAPVVLLIHDWDGVGSYEIKRAKMLGKLGYSVFVVDLFGQGVRPTEDKDKKQHTGALYADREKMRRLLNAGIAEAAKLKLNTQNLVVMGYCFGGAAALEFARSGVAANGFVSFHGGLETPEGQSYNETKGSILVFHGTADTAITMDQFADLAKRLEGAKIPHEMTTYGGAPHAFTVFDSPNYRKDADEKSWAKFVAFLREKKSAR